MINNHNMAHKNEYLFLKVINFKLSMSFFALSKAFFSRFYL